MWNWTEALLGGGNLGAGAYGVSRLWVNWRKRHHAVEKDDHEKVTELYELMVGRKPNVFGFGGFTGITERIGNIEIVLEGVQSTVQEIKEKVS